MRRKNLSLVVLLFFVFSTCATPYVIASERNSTWGRLKQLYRSGAHDEASSVSSPLAKAQTAVASYTSGARLLGVYKLSDGRRLGWGGDDNAGYLFFFDSEMTVLRGFRVTRESEQVIEVTTGTVMPFPASELAGSEPISFRVKHLLTRYASQGEGDQGSNGGNNGGSGNAAEATRAAGCAAGAFLAGAIITLKMPNAFGLALATLAVFTITMACVLHEEEVPDNEADQPVGMMNLAPGVRY